MIRPKKTHTLAALAALALFTTLPARAQLIDYALPGTTQFDGWDDLTGTGNPGYPGFPGYSAWPGPIGSNVAGSGDGEFMKTSGAGYPASGSIYAFAEGSFSLSDSTPVLDLQTIVFQINIGGGEGGLDFASGTWPTLTLNGTDIVGEATWREAVWKEQTGTFPNPDTGEDEPIFQTVWALQWDISDYASPITSYSIDWSVAPHSQTYALQLNQSDVMSQVVAVPEPSTYAAIISAGLGILAFVRRRRA